MPADTEETRSALRKKCTAFDNAEAQEREEHLEEVIRLADELLQKDAQLPQRQQAQARARAYEQLWWTRLAVGAGIGVSVLVGVLLVAWTVRDAVTPARVLGAGLLVAVVVGLGKLAAHDPVPCRVEKFTPGMRYAAAVLAVVFAVCVLLLGAGVHGGWSGWIVTVIAGLGTGLFTVGTLDEEGGLSS